MNDINLVSGKSFDIERELRRLKYLRISALGLLLVVALISIVFFIITITLPISSVKKEQQQALTGISQLHNKLVAYSLISERLTNISKITLSRKNFPQMTSKILETIPQYVAVDSLSFEANVFTLSVTSDSLIPLNILINDMISLSNKEKEQIIKNLIIKNLSFDAKSGKYSLNFQADMI
jgi:Tfp pilus assembly protein PilN